MLEESFNISEYLKDYHSGKILMGKGIGLPLDDFLRFKHSQFTIINGLDNVGKTIWMLWYMLCLSRKHDLKWCIYSGENKTGQLVRQLIQFHTGKRLEQLELKEVFLYEIEISKWFKFVDNSPFYKLDELLDIFSDGNYDGCLIDPFTGLDRGYTHSDNYEFLNKSRQFCKSTGKSLYVNTHVVSEAARRNYAENHEYAGYPYPPNKSQSEGGQPFGNRADDFITIHRLNGHPLMNYKTQIYVRKIKDTETGGQVSPIDDPIEFDYNKGLGFTLNGQNILNQSSFNPLDFSKLTPNEDFEDSPF